MQIRRLFKQVLHTLLPLFLLTVAFNASAWPNKPIHIIVPFPLWPESTLFACLVGAEPAEYLGNNLAMLPPDLVSLAIPMFEKYEGYEVVYVLNEFFRAAAEREDAILLHWDHR